MGNNDGDRFSSSKGSGDKKSLEKAKVVFLEQYRWRRAGQVLRQKLGEYAANPWFSREINKAQQIYLVDLNTDFIDDNEDIIMERCFEWFIFDYVMQSGKTPLEVFASREELSEMEKNLLEEWAQSRLSVFEVCGVLPGEGLEIKDLLFNRKIIINNYNVTGTLDKGSIVYMRVLKVGEEYEFSTGGLGLPPVSCGPLMEKISSDIGRNNAKKSRTLLSLNKYLKERAHKINAWVLDFALKAYTLDFDREQGRQVSDVSALSEKITSKLAQQITDAFLDDYYERWINQPIQVLDGKTPSESCKTVHGRAKVEELLKELEKVESSRVKKGEPNYDINKVRVRLGLVRGEATSPVDILKSRKTVKTPDWENYPWQSQNHSRVASLLKDYLKSKKYNADQEKGAIKLWFDYCSRENPGVRKDQLWVAAVVYALGRLEFNGGIQQQKLAGEFGISPSSLSEKFRSLCRSLDLVAFDPRYSSGKSPIEGLEMSDPLLAKIFYNLKL